MFGLSNRGKPRSCETRVQAIRLKIFPSSSTCHMAGPPSPISGQSDCQSTGHWQSLVWPHSHIEDISMVIISPYNWLKKGAFICHFKFHGKRMGIKVLVHLSGDLELCFKMMNELQGKQQNYVT